MSKKAQALAARYGRKSDIIEIAEEIIREQYQINAFSNPTCPIVTADPEIQAFKWGLIPFWLEPKDNSPELIKETVAKAKEFSKHTLNARAETLFEKPSYRHPIKSKRCLIPSTGFFEYHHEGKATKPYFIHLKDTEIFSIGGIYDHWTDPSTGEIIGTFSLITTEANPMMREIHNGGKNPFRMPLILSTADEERWLDPKLSHDGIESLLKPFPDRTMEAYTINSDFTHKNPHDPAIIERVI